MVGGGVSLWPNMDNMRLTSAQTARLIAINLCLAPLTIWVYYLLHGNNWIGSKEFKNSFSIALLVIVINHEASVMCCQVSWSMICCRTRAGCRRSATIT